MPTRIQDLSSSNFGDLNPKSNYVVKYDAQTKKFVLVDADVVVGFATTVSTEFIEVTKSKINTDNLKVRKLDGGIF